MKRKTIVSLIITFISCLLIFIAFYGCGNSEKTPVQKPTLSTQSFIMMDSPNLSVLMTHFSLLGIGRIAGFPIGATKTTISTQGEKFPPENLERDVTVFQVGENIIIYGHCVAYSSVTAACFPVGLTSYTLIDYWGPEVFSANYRTPVTNEILVGYNPPDFILPTYLKLAPGQYMMKIFSGETLVAIFPFEIKA